MRRTVPLLTLALLTAACDPASMPDAAVPDASADAGLGDPADAGSLDAGSLDAGDGAVLLSEEARALAATLVLAAGDPPSDPTNRFADDPAAAALGQRLFFDPRMSGPLRSADNDCVNRPHVVGERGQSGRVSCASCHVPGESHPHFVDTRSVDGTISLAADWVLRRTPSLLDVAQSGATMWDSRFDALYQTVFAALESRDEMNSSRLFMAQQLHRFYRTEYEAIFGAMPDLDAPRFGTLSSDTTGCGVEGEACRGVPGDGADYDALPDDDRTAVTRVVANAGKAVAAYLRRLRSAPSRFDAFMAGEGEMTDEEQRGLALFVGEAGCIDCHSGPYLSDHLPHNVGLRPRTVAAAFINLDDPGAEAGITSLLSDPLSSTGAYSDGANSARPSEVPDGALGAFRTPMLRGHASQPSFFHTGHVRSLRDAVAHFVRGGDQYGFLGRSELADDEGRPVPLGLDDNDIDALVAFLRTLDGPALDPALTTAPDTHELTWTCPE